MLFRAMSVALWATVCTVAYAQAQSVADVGGPANMPPAGFKGQQFVDNRGCVYLKAGYGGKTAWVPRVGRDRKALCGYPPTFGKQPAIEVAEDVAPAPAPAKPAAKPVVVAAAPAPAARSATPPASSYTPAPYAPPAPAPVVVAAAPAPYSAAPPKGTYERVTGNGAVPAGKIGCYTSAPVAERVRLRNGGTAVVCTRGDGSLDGWRPPVYPQGAPVGASLSDPPVAVARGRSQGGYVESGAYASVGPSPVVEPVPTPPPGYELAWKDDRLNPYRGVGTAEGWAQQDQVWTRKVPAKLVAAGGGTTTVSTKGSAKKGTVVISTKNSPTEPVAKPAASGRLYVQIGTFGVPSNADGASSRLKAAGLPVARSKITSKGKAMQIVLAGPFASAAEAQQALRLARGAGFGDAFIR